MTNDFSDPDKDELKAGLRAIARDEAALQASDEVEARVMRAWDAAQAERRSTTPRFVLRGLEMAAGLVLLAAGTYLWVGAQGRSTSRAAVAPQQAPSLAAPAWPADEVQAWLDVDPGPLQIVRVGVSRATLVAQGYPASDPDGDGLVEIDVVVGADGVARSIQLAAAPFY